MSNQLYYLMDHVVSNSSGKLYAVAGTKVKLLSKLGEHVNVVNVEDLHGNRFPVRVDQLSVHPIVQDIFHLDWPTDHIAKAV